MNEGENKKLGKKFHFDFALFLSCFSSRIVATENCVANEKKRRKEFLECHGETAWKNRVCLFRGKRTLCSQQREKKRRVAKRGRKKMRKVSREKNDEPRSFLLASLWYRATITNHEGPRVVFCMRECINAIATAEQTRRLRLYEIECSITVPFFRKPRVPWYRKKNNKKQKFHFF